MIPSLARSLTLRQVAVLVGVGVVLWFGVAVLLAALEPLGALRGPGAVLLYVLVIPATWPLVLLVRKAAKADRNQTLAAVAIPTATASLLDGNALIWIPGLYGASPHAAGAAILWGVGVALVFGLVMNRD